MRIALLSSLDRNPGTGKQRAAFVTFAGVMVVERQLDLALRLGCERVVCLVDAVEREVVELQHRAESAGVKFRAIRQPSRLAGMVTAADELLVLAPGMLPDDAAVESSLDSNAVLAFPADLAVPLGYERIDLESAWSGVLKAPGYLVERLGELPCDVDVPSSLMRLALQSGTGVIELDRELLAEGKWHLDADRETLDLREKRWIEMQRRPIAFRAPGLAVAERAGARLARDIVGQAAQPVPGIAAGTAALGALSAGVIGYPAIGLVLVGLASLFAHMGGVVQRVVQLGRPNSKRNPLQRVIAHVIDPIFIILLYLAAPDFLGILKGFVPLILIGLLRLGEEHASEKWRATYADRILLSSLIAPAAFAGVSTEAAAGISLLALASRFFKRFRAG